MGYLGALISGFRRRRSGNRRLVTAREQAAFTESPSGIRFLYQPAAAHDSVAVGFAFRGGTALDPADGPQTSFLAPSILIECALKRTDSRIAEALTDLRGAFVLSSEPEAAVGGVVGPRRNIKEVVRLSGAFLESPDVSEEILGGTKDLVADQIAERMADPLSRSHKAFLEALCDPHPYLRSMVPDADKVQAVSPADILDWRDTNFVRSRLMACVVGDVGETEAGSLVDSLFGGLPQGSTAGQLERVVLRNGGAEPVRIPDGNPNQAFIVIGGGTVPVSQPESWLAGRMLAHILAGDEKSRLFRDIRDGTGKTYGLQHRFDFFLNQSFLALFGAVAKDDLDGTLSAVRSSIENFLVNGPTEAEAASARTSLSMLIDQVTSDHAAFARELTTLLLFGWTPHEINNLASNPAEIDLSDPAHRKVLLPRVPVTVVAG
jgi:zinc protease